jgi:glycerol-3-phosphate dehydrogenase
LSGAELRLSSHPGAGHLALTQLHHLVARYGTLAAEVLDLIAADPGLAAPLVGAEGYVAAEVCHATAYEGALHVDDVLTRRTHIAFEVPDRGRLAADGVARLMAPVLGWDQAAVDREIAHYRARLEAEAAAQALLTDEASDSARAEVRDPRLEHFDARGE